MESREPLDLRGALARPFAKIAQTLAAGEFSPGQKKIDAVAAGVLATRTRRKIASLCGLEDSDRVFFGRNTTEALSMMRCLANVDQGEVLLTDVEYTSVLRIFLERRDHGNTARDDHFTTWSDDLVREAWSGLKDNGRQPDAANLRVVPFLGSYDFEDVLAGVTDDTRLVVLSHVVRSTGRIVDVENFARLLKKRFPGVQLAVDGAFAFGNLPRVNFAALEAAGVDYYGISPHKTLKSFPLGIMLLSRRAVAGMSRLARDPDQIIFRGMIPESYGDIFSIPEPLNPNRYSSLQLALKSLQNLDLLRGDNFSARLDHCRDLKSKFFQRLNLDAQFILSGNSDLYIPAMITIRAPDGRSRRAVERLAEAGVFCCYISEVDGLRVYFDVEHREADLDRFFAVWDRLFGEVIRDLDRDRDPDDRVVIQKS